MSNEETDESGFDVEDFHHKHSDQMLARSIKVLDTILHPKKGKRRKDLVETIARRAALINGPWIMVGERDQPAVLDGDRSIDMPAIELFQQIGLDHTDYKDWRILILALAWSQQKGRPKGLTSQKYFEIGRAFADAARRNPGSMTPELFSKTETIGGEKINASTLRRNLRDMFTAKDDIFRNFLELGWIHTKRKLQSEKATDQKIKLAKEKYYKEMEEEFKATRREDWRNLLGKK
ncbi:MAG: hypothetical protein KF835_06235 [Xanthobacteraceae bacterium]|nr:hypothetical protein [Xanthobacteraceae bacterium]MBX3549273.1 hypothetical protein [Xanthobacteraceae bacterium]